MLTHCVAEASIAMCENAKALAQIHVWMKRSRPQHGYKGDPLLTMIAAYIQLACSSVFVCSSVTLQALGVTISLHLRNSAK